MAEFVFAILRWVGPPALLGSALVLTGIHRTLPIGGVSVLSILSALNVLE